MLKLLQDRVYNLCLEVFIPNRRMNIKTINRVYWYSKLILLLFLFCYGCGRLIVESQHSEVQQTTSKSYYELWTEQLTDVVTEKYNGSLVFLLDPSHNKFPYYYLNENQNFNQATYNYISARVMPGPEPNTVQLSQNNGFTNAYVQLMNEITYKLGAENKVILQVHERELYEKSLELVEAYERIFESIDSKQIEVANETLSNYGIVIQTKLDYIFTYIMGYIWTGNNTKNIKPLSFIQIANSKSLTNQFSDIPASGILLFPILSIYLENYRSIELVENALQSNNWYMRQSLNHTQYPNEANQGILTFNPINGKTSEYQPGYYVGMSLAEIRNALNDKNRVIEINFNLNNDIDSNENKPSDDNAKDGLIVTDVSGESINLLELANTGVLTIKITYTGYVYVPFFCSTLNPKGSIGWYYPQAISQAAANINTDRTGYQFGITPYYNLGNLSDGGNFGMLTGALIANVPEVQIRYVGNQSSQLAALHKFSSKVGLWFMNGLINDNFTLKYNSPISNNPVDRTANSKDLTSTTILEISCSPSENLISIPLGLQLANVLLVSVSYPSEM